MHDTAQKLLVPTKGILAADESTGTITKRFAGVSLTSTPELNKKYREMLFTSEGLENYLSGVILFDETIHQDLQNVLLEKGIVTGIKVDGGLEPFNGTEEQITKGLEGLENRLKEYFDLGARFTKWRGAFKITDIFPSDGFLEENLNRMVSFAKLSQANQMVPIVEPEVLLDGNHTTTRCEEIMTKVLKLLFEKLTKEGVDLKNLILKTSMVLPGKDSGVVAAPLEVAQATLRTLRNSVPADVPVIVFLSGGQSPDDATNNLNAINVAAKEPPASANYPWQLSFSFSRALQNEALQAWAGRDENVPTAQKIFIERLVKVSKARQGTL